MDIVDLTNVSVIDITFTSKMTFYLLLLLKNKNNTILQKENHQLLSLMNFYRRDEYGYSLNC